MHSNPNAYIGLGSNLGDRAGNFLLAIRGLLDARIEVLRLSRIYETEAIETFAQPRFLNMVVEVRGSTLPRPEELMARLLRIEYSLGRTRDASMAPRTIDLDLLLYGDETSDTQFLSLPHPRLHLRRFVMEPLNELAPAVIHPILNKSVAELLTELQDASSVELWTPQI
jgi:2-amino-4-hydroxy-6-hydroxymethyldihydropteridine diphosphokinase